MNVLELKNDLHRLVVETEDVQLLKEAIQILTKFRLPKYNEPRLEYENLSVSIPSVNDTVLPHNTYIQEDGIWVYTGSAKGINFDTIVDDMRQARIDSLTKNMFNNESTIGY